MADRLTVEGVLLDLDGTLYQDDAALPGAVDTVARLRRAGLRLRFVTNTTRRPRRAVAEALRRMGFELDDAELLTPSVAARLWLEKEGIRRVRLYLPQAGREDFAGVDVDSDGGEPEAILVGDLAAGWTFERLNRAFRDLLAGARLVALQRNRYWRSGNELVLDAGPFVAALEFAAQVDAAVIGKPTGTFFDLACASLDLPRERVLMVGDDVESDVGGAQAAGLRGVLVRSGKFSEDALRRSGVRPDAVIDGIAALPALVAS
ncbi:MAG TPA: TIGR01458 family HAD-type hydrolase [Longimicrobiales bacterium]|nr:TIGR01458 family HAD-type hydrolase [Longimicrobiales bacterium]